jgi:hypothetical protein
MTIRVSPSKTPIRTTDDHVYYGGNDRPRKGSSSYKPTRGTPKHPADASIGKLNGRMTASAPGNYPSKL